MAVVYKITNNVNGMFYIGSTCNLKRRKYEHFGELKRHTHHSNKMQQDYDKYGKEAFSIEILEECEDGTQKDREQYYIDILDPVSNGYNQSYSAYSDSNGHPKYGVENGFYGKHHTEDTKRILAEKAHLRTGWKHTEKYKEFMSNIQQGGNNSHATKILQYDLDMNFIRKWDSIEDAVRYYKMKSKSSIANACKGNIGRKGKYRTGKGFIWFYAERGEVI